MNLQHSSGASQTAADADADAGASFPPHQSLPSPSRGRSSGARCEEMDAGCRSDGGSAVWSSSGSSCSSIIRSSSSSGGGSNRAPGSFGSESGGTRPYG